MMSSSSGHVSSHEVVTVIALALTCVIITHVVARRLRASRAIYHFFGGFWVPFWDYTAGLHSRESLEKAQ